MKEEHKTNWIYIIKSDESYFSLICLALASVASNYNEFFHIVYSYGISKYFHGLKNIEISFPEKDKSDIIYLKIPEHLNFCEICNEIESQLNLDYIKIESPYLGFVKPNKSIMRLIEDKKNIVVFSYFSVINEMAFDFKNLGEILIKEEFFPVCIGSKNEKLIKGAFDLRELADLDELLKIREKIKFIVTSNPFVKDIALLFRLKVILLNTNIISIYQSPKNYEIRRIQKNIVSDLSNVICSQTSKFKPDNINVDVSEKKKFEVPYNFDLQLLEYYKKRNNFISHLFLPPFKDDLSNTRSFIETNIKGKSYMPESRSEYEYHINQIKNKGLDFVVLWQDINKTISKDLLDYYVNLGAIGFIIANDKNAKIIKDFNPNLRVIASIVQANFQNILDKNLSFYDYLVLFYPFTRSIESIKALKFIKDKLILMPNTFCHTNCPGLHHWFAKDKNLFNIQRDCPAYNDIDHSTFIFPEHLMLFDNYVGLYKLQGREYTSDEIITVCESYFFRETLPFLISEDYKIGIERNLKLLGIDKYYNLKNLSIIPN